MTEAHRSPAPPSSGSTSPAARLAAELALDRKAIDIVVLDIAGQTEATPVTDYFVICTGRSDVHVKAICDRVVEGMREEGRALLSSEGVKHGQWALLDYGEVVVHVFQQNVRTHYDLERLWSQAPRWTYRGPSDIEESLI